MYWICHNRVILGADGFIQDQILGSQIRLFCFGLNLWWASGDKDSDGNGLSFHLGLPNVNEVL